VVGEKKAREIWFWCRMYDPHEAPAMNLVNADSDHIAGLSNMAMTALDMFAVSPEGAEGAAAFAEKRRPDFDKHVVRH
jgi:1,4-dihydroxy-2-naphthoyl-CoA synthase